MSVLSPREAVYLLARTQNDWLTLRGTTSELQSGFAEGVDDRGRQLRWISCPDCLANDRVTYGCETCHGRGEIPAPGPDPMRNRVEGRQAFYGHDHHEARDRSRAVDAQILRLRLNEGIRAGLEAPEDWLDRTVRQRQTHYRTGDYQLLEQAQDRLGWRSLSNHFLWMRAIVDDIPHGHAAAPVLDGIADWLADWMLGAIATQRLHEHLQQSRLGVRRPKLRPEMILIPAGQVEQHQPGRGRWANPHSQGQRNALIVAMAADGKTAGQIARQVGLTKRRVQQMLAEVRVESTATGPAA